MKISVDVKLRPFPVPQWVAVEGVPYNTVLSIPKEIPLKELDEDTLSGLCEQFRIACFDAAGLK